jgi:formylglycine-generating enzyme required for sulfatase activity
LLVAVTGAVAILRREPDKATPEPRAESPDHSAPRPAELRAKADLVHAEESRSDPAAAWRAEPLPRHVLHGKAPPVFILAAPGVELDLVHIPAGPFVYSQAKNGKGRIDRGFFVGRTEVTWLAYRTFCAATHRPPPEIPAFWERIEERDKDRHPVVNVSFDDASAFCAWAGGRLPADKEWERVARGADGRKYPWGNVWDATLANTLDASCPPDWVHADVAKGPEADKTVNDGFPFTAPVGSFPRGASPEGALDLLGNVWEWCSLPNPADKSRIRGGSWEMNGKRCSVDQWAWHWAGFSESIGFRIVVDGP